MTIYIKGNEDFSCNVTVLVSDKSTDWPRTHAGRAGRGIKSTSFPCIRNFSNNNGCFPRFSVPQSSSSPGLLMDAPFCRSRPQHRLILYFNSALSIHIHLLRSTRLTSSNMSWQGTSVFLLPPSQRGRVAT